MVDCTRSRVLCALSPLDTIGLHSSPPASRRSIVRTNTTTQKSASVSGLALSDWSEDALRGLAVTLNERAEQKGSGIRTLPSVHLHRRLNLEVQRLLLSDLCHKLSDRSTGQLIDSYCQFFGWVADNTKSRCHGFVAFAPRHLRSTSQLSVRQAVHFLRLLTGLHSSAVAHLLKAVEDDLHKIGQPFQISP